MKTNTNKKLDLSKKLCFECDKKCCDSNYKIIQNFSFENVNDSNKKYVVLVKTENIFADDIKSENLYHFSNLNFGEIGDVLEIVANKKNFSSDEKLVSLNFFEVKDKE